MQDGERKERERERSTVEKEKEKEKEKEREREHHYTIAELRAGDGSAAQWRMAAWWQNWPTVMAPHGRARAERGVVWWGQPSV